MLVDKVSGKNFSAYFKAYLANASSLPLNYTLYNYPVATDWEKGTGRLGNSPAVTNGASWQYKDLLSGSLWYIAGNFPSGTTGSFRNNGTSGGGLWYTSSIYQSTQSFSFATSKDIEMDVTNTVNAWYSSSISNYGIVLKHSSSVEFTSSSKFETKYFSENTHTIYPPCLEIRWDDSSYVPGALQVINNNLFIATMGENKGEFKQDSIQRFRINVRDKYPPRVFQTTSIYLVNKVLPSTSYWSLVDLDTQEIIVDYDTNYTKISCDTIGNYFTLYMNGLEPERYYKFLIKTVLATGETIVSDNSYYFKVNK